MACFGLRGAPVEQIGRSAPSASPSAETPMPIRRNFVPSVSRASRSRPAAKIRAASWVGWSSEWARVRMRKSAVLSLSVTVVPASSLALRRAETFSDRRHSLQLERAEFGDVVVERGLGRDALGLALGAHRPVVDAVGEPREPRALGAVAAHQFRLAGALQVADGAQPVAREPLLRHLADPENQRDRLRRQEGGRLARGRAPQSRAACRGRRRSWRGTCCRRARSRR